MGKELITAVLQTMINGGVRNNTIKIYYFNQDFTLSFLHIHDELLFTYIYVYVSNPRPCSCLLYLIQLYRRNKISTHIFSAPLSIEIPIASIQHHIQACIILKKSHPEQCMNTYIHMDYLLHAYIHLCT